MTKINRLRKFIAGFTLDNSIDKNSDSGECFHDYGNRWFFERWLKHQKQSDLDSSIYYTRKAVEHKLSRKPLDKVSLSKSSYNLAYFHLCNDEMFAAIKNYLDVINLNLKDAQTQFATFDLAIAYEQVGDFEKARYYYQSIIDYSLKNEMDKLLAIEAHVSLIDLYNRMEDDNLNGEVKKLVSATQMLMRNSKIHEGFQMGRFLVAKGNHYFNLEDYPSAGEVYKKALNTKTDFSNEAEAIVMNNLSICELRKEKLDSCYVHAIDAMRLDSTFSLPHETLGDLWIEKKDFPKGIAEYKKAIKIASHSWPDGSDSVLNQDFESSLNKLDILDHLTSLGNGWLDFHTHKKSPEILDSALTVFTVADELIDIIKRDNTEFKSKVFWRSKSSELYVKAVETSFLLNRATQAYRYMERNKALLLLEDLTDNEAKKVAGIPYDKLAVEYELKRDIFLSENKIKERSKFIEIDSLVSIRQEVVERKYTYERFIDSLEMEYPKYVKFKKESEVLSFKDLKANYISENRATLHYILNEEDGYGLLITADTTALYRLNDIKKLNTNLEKLTAALSSGLSNLDTFKANSNTVFKMLIPDAIYHKIKGKQLTIIPDYTLQQIPFESLVVDSDELRYLFQDVEISYAYSASLLAYNQKIKKEENPDFFGIAPITFDSLQLPELYFSEKEVKSVASVFPAKTLFNGQASKTNFIENADDYSIIHLATHADVGDGENPWIAFNDSKMYLKEIYATKNQADMVVLSACNTSSGALKRGEGIMSLARGFFYSGAKSVVSTLWPVSDEAGKDILIDFYRNLDKGLIKSKALQKAKLDYLKNTEEEELKHPYYWAGFVVLGDNSPVSEKPISPWGLTGIGLLGTGVLIFGYKKIKAHRAAA